MKVYFSGALYTQGDFQPRYKKIVKCLVDNGLEVMEDTTVTPFSKFQEMSESEILDNYKNVRKWVEKCDFAVFEASFPSTLSIGHEISLALGKGKPVIVMYLEERSPMFLLGYKNDMIIWVKYKDADIAQSLTKALEGIKGKVSVRFNFFLPRSLVAYLDWVGKDTGTNKSEYIRMLIEKEVKKK
jgi:hypothetical protein